MQRKFNQKPVYLSGRSKFDREFIYLHMSNHYRRIVNAKKAIDNSPPTCFKGKRPATSNPGVTRTKINRHFESLILTDRSISTNSNKDSNWGAESFTGGGSRYHARCVPDAPPNVSSPKVGEMDLIDRIAYDTKHGPAAYSDKGWTKVKEHQEKRYMVTALPVKTDTKHPNFPKRSLSNAGNTERTQKRKLSQKKLKPSEVPVKGSKSAPSLRDNFSSKSVSKLRSLRVYYPPRRIESRTKAENPRNGENGEAPQCKCTKICICEGNEIFLKKMSLNAKEQSVTSSRDSAYNGGVSSVPESRSPTPDQRRKKDCCCCCCERLNRMGKFRETEKQDSPSNESSTQETKKIVTSPNPPPSPERSTENQNNRKLPKTKEKDSYEKMQDDALYVTFIQEITTEVLEKNLYTNKALKKVMKKHLQKNLRRLNKERMLQELENLRIQLGIPEDKSLFDLNIEPSDSVSDVIKFYPVISDSEFVLPAKPQEDDKGLCDMKAAKKMIKSISGVFNLDDNCSETDQEEVSVVSKKGSKKKDESMEKSLRDKCSPGPCMDKVHSRESSDDSDRPSDPKKRSLTKTRRQKTTKNYPVSSSDSEMSGSFTKSFLDEEQNELLGPRDADKHVSKKTRSVSFWGKNPECRLVPGTEIKTKKTVVTHSEESVTVDVKKNKQKQT